MIHLYSFEDFMLVNIELWLTTLARQIGIPFIVKKLLYLVIKNTYRSFLYTYNFESSPLPHKLSNHLLNSQFQEKYMYS